MAITAEIIDLDGLFRNLPFPPIVLNNFNLDNLQDKEEIDRLVFIKQGEDYLDSEPKCMCEHTRGGEFIGIQCPKCFTMCEHVTERTLNNVSWLRKPPGVAAFMNPKVYSILSSALTHSKFNILEHLLNPYATSQDVKPIEVKRYYELNLPRGINYFYEHFDEIIDKFVEVGVLKREKDDKLFASGKVSQLLMFIKAYRDMIFCDHLPMPNRVLLITEKTPMTTFASKNIFSAIDAVRNITDLEDRLRKGVPMTSMQIQHRAIKANIALATYSQENFDDFFDGKKGCLRQHTFGSASHFTLRAVIDSITGPHDYLEIHLPWSIAVMVFRLHLFSKLLHYGWSHREATALLEENTNRFNPVINELFIEMLREGPGGRFPILLNRNPSLVFGSIQQLFITKIKTDVNIKSMSISSLILTNFNADFDGDRLCRDAWQHAFQYLLNCLGTLEVQCTTTRLERADVTTRFKKHWV